MRTWQSRLVVVVLGLFVAGAAAALAQAPPPPSAQSLNTLAGEVEIARLIDLSAEKLGLNIQYDPQALRGAKATLRLRRGVTDDELWTLTNALLASRGFTVVELPETGFLSIVKVQDAPGAAPLVPADAPGQAGFVSVLYQIRHQPAKAIIETVRPLLSKPAGAVAQLGQTDLLLVSEYRSRLEQVMGLIEQIDVEPTETSIETVEVEYLAASQLVSLVTGAANAYGAVTGQPLRGKLIPAGVGNSVVLVSPADELQDWRELLERFDRPLEGATMETIPVQYLDAQELIRLLDSVKTAVGTVAGGTMKGQLVPTPDGDAVVVIAPAHEIPEWQALAARFDRRQPLETRTYLPSHFGPDEVARLIEETARDTGPKGSGDRWRIVTNDLTSTLMVTATPAEHTRIVSLIERLDQVPRAARQSVRTFAVRNRNVTEIVDVLNHLIEAGVLEGSISQAPSGPSQEPGPRQQTRRDVVQSAGEPITSEETQEEPAPSVSDARPTPAAPLSSALNLDEDASLKITADESTNTLIAVGDARRLDQLGELIRTLDIRQSQVMIETLLVVLNDDDTFDLGVEIAKVGASGNVMFALASLFGLGDTDQVNPPDGGDVTVPDAQGGTLLVLEQGAFAVLVRALETLNKGRVLNMPKMLVNNHEEASLDAVLQQPFTSTNTSTTVNTTSFGGTQDAGTTVTIQPHIAEGDHLVLDYSVSLSTFVGDSGDPNIPPPRQQNSLESVITLPDGHVLAVGGLESTIDTKFTSQVPLLGDIPFIGELFKTRSNSTSTSRFFVFIKVDILRHGGFEELKYISDRDIAIAEIDDGWPTVEPRVMR